MDEKLSVKFYIETVGCQMNVLDSELAAAELVKSGYIRSETRKGADIILFNTCSVREHAEEKIYSALGRLKNWKDRHPNGIIGVMGCMAQKDQKIIFRRAPHVDLVLGPGRLDDLPKLIENLRADRDQQQIAVSLGRKGEKLVDVCSSFRQFDPIRLRELRPTPFQAMLRIMFGCDKFCSYCIVPSVRGPEQSRPIRDIVSEAETLASQGCLELTLIGQTVNSYRYEQDGRVCLMQDLLEKINNISGIERIRFVSNYPTDMSDELLQAVRDLPKVMPFIHVPAQHGADSVLKRMHRRYTVAEYRELIDRIYSIIPGVAITSDFIVGFCGETEEEFFQTADLIRYCRFKNSFIFKYSARRGTKSAELFADDVPDSVKKRRNNELLAIQDEISSAWNDSFKGKTVEILVEGPSKTQNKTEKGELTLVPSPKEIIQLSGRTPCDRIVVFDGSIALTGTLQQVKISESGPFTLFGEILEKC